VNVFPCLCCLIGNKLECLKATETESTGAVCAKLLSQCNGYVVVQMINKAHDDWVTGLILIPRSNYLLSCCRGGMLKVWNVDNCSLVGDTHAHNSPINALAANSQLLFAASKYGHSFHLLTVQFSVCQRWLAVTVLNNFSKSNSIAIIFDRKNNHLCFT